MLADS